MSGSASIPAAQRSGCDRARPAPGWGGTSTPAAAPYFTRSRAQSLAPVPAPPLRQQGMTLAGEWPLRDHLSLGAMPGAVRCARLHTRLVLAEWGLTCLTEQAQLIASELVTNAVAASRQLPVAFPVWLWLLADSNWLLIAVWDANPQLPVPSDVDELAESGRGLVLVGAIAAGWDAYPTPDWGGKIVRAMCAR